ncbi:HMA2 domain-containing protein [Campylobacter fetus]|uniref:HMA2 domain-containing protein n=1 Tax=Campylobacter fetus TaxID=196 RepID=UPI0008189598|nr:hypothetical protein [Campylobacter fetus]OCR97038.1 hypothetical protein CFT12S02847_00560 [Campylobacter fetus subsp. testudinum]OCS02234.1 hypothetical protein CFT85387_00830 [Campylobacter fetus subsp. testudinum]OCS04640.1 hypothetical protein CFTCF782_00715 [Campylobacter fetus subsp. testudinum]
MSSNLNILNEILPYFSLIHSVPGRLRVRVSPRIKELQSSISLDEIDKIIAKIDGINSVKFNKLVGSVTVLYDQDKFPEQLWNEMLNGRNLEHISKKIEEIKRSYNAN